MRAAVGEADLAIVEARPKEGDKTIKFWKVESIGNDFVLILEDDASELDLPVFARQVCARRFSIGSDGLLSVGRRPGGLSMRMFNPDGTEDFCGNGMRCAALFGSQQGWVEDQFTIQHLGREIRAWKGALGFGTELARTSFDPKDVPHLAQSELFLSNLEGQVASAVSTGSTHLVILADVLPDEKQLLRLGPLFENHPLFPNRTSVIWGRVDAERKVAIRIWERGVGETMGCGTGSGAVAAVYSRKTGITGAIEVLNPGGLASVLIERGDSPLRVEAEARILFEGLV